MQNSLDQLHSYGMSSAMAQRGMPHGLKLDTHGLNTMDFTDSLRTAPPAALFSHQFSFNDNMLFGPGPTINPSALHYDSPQMLGLEPPSPFNHGMPDMDHGHGGMDMGGKCAMNMIWYAHLLPCAGMDGEC